MIKILVDSSSDCRAENGVFDAFMPIAINIDGKEYLDGVDIDADRFYELLLNAEEFPRTSQPSPQAFAEIFEQVKGDGDELLYLALSSALSGTYQGAMLAKEMVGYDRIRIVDSRTASHLIGVLARYARRLIGEGCTLDEVADACEQLKSRIKVLAGVDTLEYLYRGGRLSRTSAAVGSLAGIKPVLTVSEEGAVEPLGKCLGKGRAMQFILDRLATFELDEEFPLLSLFTYGEENCAELENKLAQNGYTVQERLQIGSAIGTHVGPGVYGVVFVTK